MTSDIERLTQLVRKDPTLKLNSLMGMVFRPEGLSDSFERLAGNKAPGVDGVRKDDYRNGLSEKISDLSERLRRMGYRPQPSRRVYIPKANGGRRPLGIPAFEDRIVQDRLSQVLQAIYEPEFLDCSYGFRPSRSAHDALRKVAEIITIERTQYVVEADIKGFFDNVDHEWMVRFLEHRISDERFMRTLRRFLKAGVMEDGAVHASEEGTPQGGLVSPCLANVYLHYVLDLWFEKRFAPTCGGKAHMVRYADDFVACFSTEDEAKRFLKELTERLGQFGLEVEPTKTRLIRFGSKAAQRSYLDRLRRPATFSFLGFTHFVTKSRKGGFLVGRKTDRQRMRKKLKELNVKMAALRAKGAQAMVTYAQQHLRGHVNYYSVSGNLAAVEDYYHHLCRILHKWLNRRSQRKSLDWIRFNTIFVKGGLLPRVRLVQNLYNLPGFVPR